MFSFITIFDLFNFFEFNKALNFLVDKGFSRIERPLELFLDEVERFLDETEIVLELVLFVLLSSLEKTSSSKSSESSTNKDFFDFAKL
jgi:hypothetical protein